MFRRHNSASSDRAVCRSNTASNTPDALSARSKIGMLKFDFNTGPREAVSGRRATYRLTP